LPVSFAAVAGVIAATISADAADYRVFKAENAEMIPGAVPENSLVNCNS